MPIGSVKILHEDSCLLFVDKPARMLTVPAPSGQAKNKGPALSERLVEAGYQVFPVHRLDYETSGVVVFAKSQDILDGMIEEFRSREVEKTYLAVVQGWPHPKDGVIDAPIRDLGASAVVTPRGAPALTNYWTRSQHGPVTLLKVKIETGRHNQIRIHLAHIGHPLVGERKYAFGRDDVGKANRALLHAHSIAFKPPHLTHVLRITSPMPSDFTTTLAAADEFVGKLDHLIRPKAAPKPPTREKKREGGRGGRTHFRGGRR